MHRYLIMSTIPILLCLAGAFLTHSKATANTAYVCMGKVTQGKPGGDHQFILEVPAEKVDGLTARGFIVTNCRANSVFATKIKPQMCALAALSNPAVDDDFQRMYSLTPREICEL